MSLELVGIGSQLLQTAFSSIFGNVDKGHWEGSLYIPGDYQSRLNKVLSVYLPKYNLLQTDVNFKDIELILKTPGDWNARTEIYLKKVVQTKQANIPKNPTADVDISNPTNSNGATVPGNNNYMQSGGSFPPIAIIGGLALLGIVLSYKK